MSALARLRGARVACSRPLTERQELHILHGMGRTLGDSIVGLSVLAWVKSIAPNLRIHVYRASHATDAAEQLYRLAEHVVSRVHHLPLPDAALPADAIDVSDFLYWPMFSVRPLVDFFLEGLGLAREAMPAAFKANHWL